MVCSLSHYRKCAPVGPGKNHFHFFLEITISGTVGEVQKLFLINVYLPWQSLVHTCSSKLRDVVSQMFEQFLHWLSNSEQYWCRVQKVFLHFFRKIVNSSAQHNPTKTTPDNHSTLLISRAEHAQKLYITQLGVSF